MTGHLPGLLGAMAEEEIRAGRRATVSWEDLLARFVTGIRRSDFRTFPFNRKHIHRGLYLPSLGAPGPQHLVAAIDTSGSITLPLAERLLAELDALRAATECELTVIQCDAAVTSVQTFDPWESSILPDGGAGFRLVGRGGTDFRPVFEWLDSEAALELPPADAVLYLTDGFGMFPAREPEVPVSWIVTPRGASAGSFPFGMVIPLTEASAAD
jgi:predicted metal-dependent peptidase